MNIQNISDGRNCSLYLIKTVTHYSLLIQSQEYIDIICLHFISYFYEYKAVFQIPTNSLTDSWLIISSIKFELNTYNNEG